jgi:hypothetical protein
MSLGWFLAISSCSRVLAFIYAMQISGAEEIAVFAQTFRPDLIAEDEEHRDVLGRSTDGPS